MNDRVYEPAALKEDSLLKSLTFYLLPKKSIGDSQVHCHQL